MKKNTETVSSAIKCIIGAETEITGNIKTKEAIRIEGKVNGDVISESLVITGTASEITGNVKATSLSICGKVNGDVTAEDKLELLSTASVKGNITAKTLVIDENAFFDGNCHMTKA